MNTQRKVSRDSGSANQGQQTSKSPQRQLGRLGPRVSALGLGCMSLGIADVYTSSVRDEGAAVSLIGRALHLGITLLDTADIYGDSEIKVGKAIKRRRADVVLATKFGFVQRFSAGGSARWRISRRTTGGARTLAFRRATSGATWRWRTACARWLRARAVRPRNSPLRGS